MLDVKALLTKMLSRQNGSKTYNTNKGTLIVDWYQQNRVVFLALTIHTTSTWATGSGNRITCTVDSNIPLPPNVVNGTELNGIFCHINGTTFRAQNNTGSTLPANGNYNASLTYVI